MVRAVRRAAGRAAAAGFGTLALACAPAAEPSALTLHYQPRVPHSALDADGRVTGIVATPAARALERAGIAHVWQSTPAQRQLALIQHGEGLHCGIGWFRTPEREALGRFSAPLYRDQPLAALVRAGALPEAGRAVRAADLLRDGGPRLLVKEGYSYGAHFDGLIAQAAAPVARSTAEVDALARMVAAGRADWMLASPEEVPAMHAALGAGAAPPRLLTLVDAPPGATRHLYCNRAVPAAWIERIDRALEAPPAPARSAAGATSG